MQESAPTARSVIAVQVWSLDLASSQLERSSACLLWRERAMDSLDFW
jgi:hypothetical protein